MADYYTIARGGTITLTDLRRQNIRGTDASENYRSEGRFRDMEKGDHGGNGN